jgi:hypothetical protein
MTHENGRRFNDGKEHIRAPFASPSDAIYTHGPSALTNFLSHLNYRHTNIKFSMELERNANYSFWMSWSTNAWTMHWGTSSTEHSPTQTGTYGHHHTIHQLITCPSSPP